MKDEPKIKDRKTIIHISMTKCGLCKDSGVIVWPKNPIDGKTIFIETRTPKLKNGGYGKAKLFFYLNEPNSPTFKSANEFIKYYATISSKP